MTHKHLHLQDLFEASLLDKIKQSELIENCDYCRKRLNKAGHLLSKLTEREILNTEKLYDSIKNRVQDKEDFLGFISGSKYAREKKKVEYKPEVKKFKFKITGYIAAGIAACFLILINFYYYLLLPDENYIKASNNLNIARKGFIAGEIKLRSDMLLMGKDIASNENNDIVINTGKGMKLYIKKMSSFYFKEKDNVFYTSILKGKYFIHFDQSYKKKWIVELPMASRIIVTGTQIYLDADKDKYNIYLKVGKAELHVHNNKVVLDPRLLYTLAENKDLDSAVLSEKEGYKLLEPFMQLEGFDSFINYQERQAIKKGESHEKKKEITIKNKKKLTLTDLKKRYGTLSIITTQDNKRYIGAFKIMGDKIQITTTSGEIILPASKIKNLSPYQE